MLNEHIAITQTGGRECAQKPSYKRKKNKTVFSWGNLEVTMFYSTLSFLKIYFKKMHKTKDPNIMNISSQILFCYTFL